jgi:hypothetical protein
MILGGGELLRATILLGLPSVLFSYGDGVDIMEWMCPPVAPKGLEAEGQDLYCWAESLGASTTKCRRIVGLLNVRWMCSLPLPRNTYKVAGISEAHWQRFLFRRHVKDILYWTIRLKEGDPVGFSERVNWLIRNKFFPEREGEGDDEIAGRSEAGRCHELPCTKPERTGSIKEAPQCCNACYTSMASGRESATDGVAVPESKHQPPGSPSGDNPHPSTGRHGEFGSSARRCAPNPKPGRILPRSLMRSGEGEGRTPASANTRATSESYAESPGPPRRSPWSPPGHPKRGRR